MSSKHAMKIMTYVLVALFVMGMALSFSQGESGGDALAISLLFSLPLVGFFADAYKTPVISFKLQLISGFLSALLYLAWIGWSVREKAAELGVAWLFSYSWPWSLVLFIAAFVLMATVFALARELTGLGERDSAGTRSNGIWTITFFLGLFLIVTYLLAMSLAFHNDLEPRALLYAAGIPSQSRPFGTEGETEDTEGGISRGTEVELQNRTAYENSWWFAFDEGKATVEIDNSLLGIPSRTLQADHEGNGEIQEELLRQWSNARALENAARFILDRDDYQRLQVTLRGHASDARLRNSREQGMAPDYRSNYELSLARVKQVEQHLRDKLSSKGQEPNNVGLWHNLEWILIPLSNEGDPNPSPELFDEALDESTSVVVKVAEVLHSSRAQSQMALPREMRLLDYVYFMIYTITTTGYGDIVPVSSFSKLVTSIANLFELFFLVVFLNILLNVMFERYPPVKTAKLGPRPVEATEVRQEAK